MVGKCRFMLVLVGWLMLAGCGRPTADGLYQSLCDRYGKAQTWQTEGSITQTSAMPLLGESRTNVTYTAAAKRPNLLRVEFKAEGRQKTLLVQDGSATWCRLAVGDGYAVLKAPAGQSLADPAVFDMDKLPRGLDVLLFMGQAPQPAPGSLALAEELDELGGRRCYVLSLTVPDGEQAGDYRLHVGRRDKLLYGVHQQTKGGPFTGTMHEVMHEVELGGRIADETFTFQPSADEQVYEGDSLTEAAEKLMRAELGGQLGGLMSRLAEGFGGGLDELRKQLEEGLDDETRQSLSDLAEALLGGLAEGLGSTPPAGGEGAKAPLLGQSAPLFELHAADGRTVKLLELRGKPVVVVFCGSWVPSSQDSLAAAAAVQDKLGDQVSVLAVTADNDDQLAGYLREHSPTLPLLHDPDEATQGKYGVKAIPTTVVIDSAGVVQDIHVGPDTAERLEALVQPLLPGPAKTGPVELDPTTA